MKYCWVPFSTGFACQSLAAVLGIVTLIKTAKQIPFDFMNSRPSSLFFISSLQLMSAWDLEHMRHLVCAGILVSVLGVPLSCDDPSAVIAKLLKLGGRFRF